MFQLDLDDQVSSQVDREQTYDAVIIGAGAAGLTAGIYLSRDRWKTLLLEKKESGGLTATTHSIENYPGFPEGIEGQALMKRFKKQALRFGADLVEFQEVTRIQENEESLFEVTADNGETYRTRSVLIATGSAPKKLGIPGEEKYYNAGVSYCATCDGPLYQDQKVAVIGCGNSGLQEAQILLQYADQVHFVEYLPYSIAEMVLQDRVKSHAKSTCLLSHKALEITGDKRVHGLRVENIESGQVEELQVSAVFIYIGYKPYTNFVDGWVDLDEDGYVIADGVMRTSRRGVFAAGDVRSGNLAQVAVAVGDGAKAAVAIREYLQEQHNR